MLSPLFSKAAHKIAIVQRSLATSIRKLTGKSDYKKWSQPNELSPDWDRRTQKIATLIKPQSSVLEFGAGRMILKQFLPEGCTYIPSDLVDRGQDTLVCDLNSNALPQFPTCDVAVFSGVFEYVHDVPRLIYHISSYVDVVIASYVVSDIEPTNRRMQGWVNDYTSEEILQIFERSGFLCDYQEEAFSQIIYRFIKKNQ
ncbi:hypothetical protein PN462_22570 [Spirulina sp. CS-785/01]|uniref:methyltransferase domain-containing protein n=1 Tax=Spirulina sp. CS-785/01 TaxID=3021716 RepID=UPI00232CB92A|nr:methyltransferase domain-containing protein [Spirulina sp. CS-785/01]MDB9315914.1 hypothetical protein [Spirulina sp. CS-785/01]